MKLKTINSTNSTNRVNAVTTIPRLLESPVFQSINKISLYTKQKTVEQEEILCCLLGRVGFSGRLISKKTGLSLQQVWRTLKKADIKLYDFRNGESHWGKLVSNKCVERVNGERKQISKYSSKQLSNKQLKLKP